MCSKSCSVFYGVKQKGVSKKKRVISYFHFALKVWATDKQEQLNAQFYFSCNIAMGLLVHKDNANICFILYIRYSLTVQLTQRNIFAGFLINLSI